MMSELARRLDEMEAAIRKPSFRSGRGRANEVNYWVFDYPPDQELEVRERIKYLVNKNRKGSDGFELVVFDLYDLIIDHLESKNFLKQCMAFEQKQGFVRITKAVNNSMKISDSDSLIVRNIREHTPENAVVFLTGIGKCYPILRSHKVLNTLHQGFGQASVGPVLPWRLRRAAATPVWEDQRRQLLPGVPPGEIAEVRDADSRDVPQGN